MILEQKIRAALKASDDAKIAYMKAHNQILAQIPPESREKIAWIFVSIDKAAEDAATNKRGSKIYKRAKKYLRYIERELPEHSTNPDAVKQLLSEYLRHVELQRGAYAELDKFRAYNPAAYELALHDYLAEFDC